jgi:galactose mutarotase-like enzyme
MYHFNLGFPLVGPNTELSFPKKKLTPRSELAAQHMAEHTQLLPPTKGWSEHVFIMDAEPAADGYAMATITNRDAGLAAAIRFRTDTLPYLVQWKQMGVGDYVLGVEPVNSSAMEGRVDARNKGVLVELEPGESRKYSITFSVEAV